MTCGKQAACGCNRKARTTASQLGLDELMIVNPGPGDAGGMFLGDDGTLYHVQGESEQEQLRRLGQLFLGDDGSLYAAAELGGYLLAADGTLYEVTR